MTKNPHFRSGANIGANNPVELSEFIETLEEAPGEKAEKEFVGMQKGDVKATYADTNDLTLDSGFKPKTALKDGLRKLVHWHRDYYNPNSS